MGIDCAGIDGRGDDCGMEGGGNEPCCGPDGTCRPAGREPVGNVGGSALELMGAIPGGGPARRAGPDRVGMAGGPPGCPMLPMGLE